jgi:hypothetical protein
MPKYETYKLVEVINVPERLRHKLKVGDCVKVIKYRKGEDGELRYWVNISRRTNTLYHRNCCVIKARDVKDCGRTYL